MTRIFVFDAYGTLFNVHAAAGRYASEIGPNYERLSQIWRQKHLEYTWIHAQTNRPISFWALTGRSLDYAAASIGGISPDIRAKLLQAYRRMDAYPEVPSVLAALKAKGVALAILTNGDPDMIADAVAGAGLTGVFDHVISVAEAGIFKPDMRVYRLVTDRCRSAPADVTFFSQNRWDIAGAHVFGFDTVWVNRLDAPDEYPDMPAARTVRDLTRLAA
jgi:2-haloacid dehalogenase